MNIRKLIPLVLSMWLGAAVVAAAPAPDSKRLGRAKDYIADEQWPRAVAELKAVVDDPKEPNRDEALFWLAHSEHQTGDQASAIETIARLERDYPSSKWVRPARSLRIEIAQRLRRDDFLWWTAVPPAPPAPPPPEMYFLRRPRPARRVLCFLHAPRRQRRRRLPCRSRERRRHRRRRPRHRRPRPRQQRFRQVFASARRAFRRFRQTNRRLDPLAVRA